MRISSLEINQGSEGQIFEFLEFESRLEILPLTFSRATEIIDLISIALGTYLKGIDSVNNEAPKFNTYCKPTKLAATGTFEGEHISWQVGTDSKLKTSYKDAKNLTEKVSTMLSQSRAGGDFIFPMLGRYGCDMDQTDFGIPYMKAEEGVIHGYKNAFNPPDKTGTDALSWFKTMSDEIRKFDQDSDKALIKAFKEALISVIGGSDFQEPSIVPFVKDIYYDFKKDDMVILLSLLFDDEGEKNYYSTVSRYARNIVGLTADIAYRCIKLNPHLGQDAVTKTPGIVLIDDINSYLFSKEDADFAKRELNILLKTFPQIQFIASFYGDHNILASLGTHYEFPSFVNTK